ncbi:MAG TPA: hypothetical protein VF765_17790 [Polyangiaceae bacterium]
MKHIGLLSALGVAGAILSLSHAALAADTTVVQAPPPAPPPQPVVAAQPTEQVPSYTGPNVRLITTGLVTFGLAYVPALVVAGESTQSADRNLYIPVAGPWIDIANRPTCGTPGGPDCTTETTDKVLIGVSGVFQGVGAVMTVLGLLTPEHHEIVTTTAKAEAPKPTIHISPASVGSGYGLGAVGTW